MGYVKNTKLSTLACCYFPTTVAFIDDHQIFLDNITSSLKHSFIRVPFVKVSEFNQFLAEHPSQLQAKKWTQSNDDVGYPDHTHHDVSINFHMIHKQIYDENRYREIAVVVVDYAMPECNGIELSQAIRKVNPHIKILLLTGEADHEIAVDAFNNKLIDKFILKEKGKEFISNVDKAIHELSQDYFIDIFENLGMNLASKNPLLKETAFLNIFNSLYEKHQGCEYYLIDPAGGYLILNAQGDAKWLIIRDEEDFRVYCELADNEEDINADTLALIKEKKKMPFYHGEYNNLPNSNEWNNHLITSEILTINSSEYTYTNCSGFEHSIIEETKIFSFERYLKNR